MKKMSKKAADEEAERIIDTFAELEFQLATAETPVLKALSRKLALIYASQLYEIDQHKVPDNGFRGWCLNHIDLMAPIRNVWLGNVDLDFTDEQARLIADSKSAKVVKEIVRA